MVEDERRELLAKPPTKLDESFSRPAVVVQGPAPKGTQNSTSLLYPGKESSQSGVATSYPVRNFLRGGVLRESALPSKLEALVEELPERDGDRALAAAAEEVLELDEGARKMTRAEAALGSANSVHKQTKSSSNATYMVHEGNWLDFCAWKG